MKQVILLLTNRTDCAVHDRYQKLVKDYGMKADVTLLFDSSSSFDPEELKDFDRVYTFSVQNLIEEGYDALEEGFLGNCHYPLLKFIKDHPEYDFCWLLEDDVTFSGNWSKLFDAYFDDETDLITTKIRKYEDEPNWFWWKSVKAPEGETLSPDELYTSFNPIYRLSAKLLRCLETEMRRGWCGHFEALVPTVAARHGLTMRDMGGEGRYVKPGDENRFYTGYTHTWTPLSIQSMKPNMIYHPIKEKISRKSDRRNCLIAVVGEHSRHQAWMNPQDVERNYDIHLIVNDTSFGMHYDDADFAYGKAGRPTALLKDYLEQHPHLLDVFDYFFIIDEMTTMSVHQINALFDDMHKELSDFSLVDLNMPCFRQDVLRLVINEKNELSVIYF